MAGGPEAMDSPIARASRARDAASSKAAAGLIERGTDGLRVRSGLSSGRQASSTASRGSAPRESISSRKARWWCNPELKLRKWRILEGVQPRWSPSTELAAAHSERRAVASGPSSASRTHRSKDSEDFADSAAEQIWGMERSLQR